jgi:hypothetical protein
MNDAIPAIISGFVGIGIGWMGHTLAVRRDCENRKRVFRAFIAQWHSEIENSPNIGGHFSEFIHLFRGECAKVGNDFFPRSKFQDLITAVSSLDRTEVEEGDQSLLGRRLDAILKFTNDA